MFFLSILFFMLLPHLLICEETGYMFDKDLKACICEVEQNNDKNKTFETLAAIEHTCAKKIFDKKMEEVEKFTKQLKANFLKDISIEKDKKIKKNKIERLKYFSASSEKFINYIKIYGQQQSHYFLRTSPYHLYGSMVDMLEIRLKHLKNLE